LNAIKETQTPALIDDYQLRYPTLVDDVAKVCLFIAEKQQEMPVISGMLHWSGEEQMTKYAMVCTMVQLFGLSMDHLKPNKSPPSGPTQRPYNPALHSGKLEDMMDERKSSFRTSFKDGIEKYLKKYV
jgi:dTDP-4-dehydrorhamnose reductase